VDNEAASCFARAYGAARVFARSASLIASHNRRRIDKKFDSAARAGTRNVRFASIELEGQDRMAIKTESGNIGHHSAPAPCPLLLDLLKRTSVIDTLPDRISYVEER
jgi:hypothetical protein